MRSRLVISRNNKHPWMKFVGKYKDDPQFDDMLAYLEADRRELDVEMEESAIKYK